MAKRSSPATPARPSAPPPAPGAVARIVAAARRHFTSLGSSRTTMDDLAGELGMSKKTLYLHFPGKEALISHMLEAKIAEVRGGMRSLVEDESVPVMERAHRMMAFIVRQMSEVSPAFLRDLERHHPALYARMESVRAEILPQVWRKLLTDGAAEGLIRPELDPAFVSELMLTTVQGLLRPASLDRLQLPPHEVIDRVLTVLFNGILTPAGRKAYEKGPSR
ncbi:MAG TPA: TetR/AcrR family transcriptional regulator [Opitutaceae bacterium]|nr:TetR/AcrR family transcriptional regulator [Opitutaceae bacterium]